LPRRKCGYKEAVNAKSFKYFINKYNKVNTYLLNLAYL